MRIVLFNNCVTSRSADVLQRNWVSVHIGVASIAGYLRSRGHDIVVLDPRLERLTAEQVSDRVLALAPDFVGYTAITEEIYDAAEIAQEVKKRCPRIVNVLGGCHASALTTETLREFPGFDIAVRGEGEVAFAAIAHGTQLEDIPEIAYRTTHGDPVFTGGSRMVVTLDELPFPAWDLCGLTRYRPPMLLELARACPHFCSFCFHSPGKNVRYKSPERAVDEIAYCANHYGVRHMHFGTNGTWPLARRQCEQICEGILARNLKVRWRTSTRVDCVDLELLALMRRAGCDWIDFGIETGSLNVLACSGKRASLDRAIKTIEDCHNLGIEVELNFLLGLPYENEESLRHTYNLVRRLRRYSTLANFSILVPFPGTEVYEMALNNQAGLRITDTDWRRYTKQRSGVLTYDNLSRDDLYAWQARMYRCYYLSFRKILQVLRSRNTPEIFSLSRLLYLMKSPFLSRPGKQPDSPVL